MTTKSIAETQTPVNNLHVLGRDRVTVLTCRTNKAVAAKTWKRGKDGGIAKGDIRLGSYFDAEQHAVNNLYDLALLLDHIADDPTRLVVRADLANPKISCGIRRRYKGDNPDLVEAKRQWLILDFDSVPWENIDYAHPKATIEAFLDSIPQLRGLTVYWRVSGSWGMTEGLRVWVAVWLSEPVSDADAKRFAGMIKQPVDVSLFNPVQPHFTATPVFDGVEDPVKDNRSDIREGELDELYVGAGIYTKELDYWIRRIETLGDDEPRHAVINRAAFALGGWTVAGLVDKRDLAAALVEACADSGAFDAERLLAAESEIKRAIADGAKLMPREVHVWESRLLRDKKTGQVQSVIYNFMLYFQEHPKLKNIMRVNARAGLPEFCKAPPWDSSGLTYPRFIKDSDDFRAVAWLQEKGLRGATPTIVHGVLKAIAEESTYDPVVDYLDALPQWDRVGRCEDLFIRGAGVEESIFARATARCFLISAVARARKPGCKVDMVPTLISPREGIGKSTFFRLLCQGAGEEAFCDTPADYKDTAKLVESMQRAWIIEDAELVRAGSKEFQAVKRAITVQSDTVRLAWGRNVQTWPRRSVFVATANDGEPLAPFENRRWPTMQARVVDLAWLLANREQLWAEADYLFKSGAQWYFTPAEEVEMDKNQVKFVRCDPWEKTVREWLDGAEDPVTGEREERKAIALEDVLTKALGLDHSHSNVGVAKRAATVMRKLGWTVQHTRYGNIWEKE